MLWEVYFIDPVPLVCDTKVDFEFHTDELDSCEFSLEINLAITKILSREWIPLGY